MNIVCCLFSVYVMPQGGKRDLLSISPKASPNEMEYGWTSRRHWSLQSPSHAESAVYHTIVIKYSLVSGSAVGNVLCSLRYIWIRPWELGVHKTLQDRGKKWWQEAVELGVNIMRSLAGYNLPRTWKLAGRVVGPKLSAKPIVPKCDSEMVSEALFNSRNEARDKCWRQQA